MTRNKNVLRDGGVGVHIRFFGNDDLGFRPYGESLGKAPSNQGLLPLSFGASPRLGMPSLRSCSVGPPPSLPGCPLRRTSTRPLEGAVHQDQKLQAS
ncbi:hypothetical protein PS862_01069 [Pseudomonas fluorescens]|uniref:Uncharacterized protein n=1 Tax=Pseudomonas fluorescens TaxID=294 RepID=A0A5E7HTT8_PSEFL|nr:hypothetical protein PS639_04084 [Pseudomonas fluorescens]VVO65757.1 hypothetical protein PS862_01069 [Pseudomonas fluorescens]